MISGSVYIDLTAETDSDHTRDRRLLSTLEQAPDGARVVVDIGSRTLVTQDVATWLNQHGSRLDIEIRGQRPEVVLAFVRAGRAGMWPVVA